MTNLKVWFSNKVVLAWSVSILVSLADKIQDRAQAERFLRAWLYDAQASGLFQLVKFTQTLQHWWQEFLNYFNEGFTSAVIEGLNNAIRGTIRRAYGYHVFENFRLHAIVEHGDLPSFSH